MKFVLVVLVVLHFVEERCATGNSPVCQPKSSCNECLKSPGCAWCSQKDFLMQGESNERRCDSPESLKVRKCRDNYLNNPSASTIDIKNSRLNSDLENVVQLQPQNIKVKLRVGVPHEFNVKFRRAEGYPIDLYYLMDLSYSMKDDLDNIKNLGQNILNKLQEVTQTVRIGFGSFVDKEKLPYVSQIKRRRKNPCPNRLDVCQPAFTFKNFLPLTSNANEFKEKVSQQKISGNLDSPEAGLDAIMQAAVCQTKIKWGNVTRILVYTSDDTFHMAGDGRLAGIFRPHDGQCHLGSNNYYEGTSFDYPSVGHLSRVLQANNIQLIFAVTERSFPEYQALSALIPQSVVGVLKDDSSNVVQLISEAYGNLSTTLLLEQDHSPAGLQISYRSLCRSGEQSEWLQKGECTGIKVNQEVDFNVRLNATECLNEPEMFEIRMQGINEVLKVTVETLCTCDCKDEEKDSKHCNGKGTLNCGVCSCNEGRLGQECSCDNHNNTSMLAKCRPNRSSEVCNSHGSCECGKCLCKSPFRGAFCECSDQSCERHNNKICNDQGKCECGKCECNSTYTGSACQCSTNKSKCMSPKGVECSGQGECVCNQCKCNLGFMKDDCSQILQCESPFKDCVACVVEKGHDSGNCTTMCGAAKVTRLQGSHELSCMHNNTMSYAVRLESSGTVHIEYADLPRTIDKTKLIIGTSVSTIIVLGILIIVAYKVLLELYDRREYNSFIKSQQQTEWKETQNPLFQGATTTVLNPLHTQEG